MIFVLCFVKNNKKIINPISIKTIKSLNVLKILSKKLRKSTPEISPASPPSAIVSAMDDKMTYVTNVGSLSFFMYAKNTMNKIDTAIMIRASSFNIFFSPFF